MSYPMLLGRMALLYVKGDTMFMEVPEIVDKLFLK